MGSLRAQLTRLKREVGEAKLAETNALGDLAQLRDRVAKSPADFARHLGLEPEPWQEHLLESSANRKILNCSRQSGKTTFVGVKALHTALFTPGSLVLIFSPSLRQSQEFFRKVRKNWESLGLGWSADSERRLGLELPNGSRIEALPGTEKTTRGFSAPACVIMEEAAFIGDDVYHGGARPMIATHPEAEVVLLSSPNGKQGFFHKVWVAGGPQWARYQVDAPGKPGSTLEPGELVHKGRILHAVSEAVRPEYIEEEREEKTDNQIRQEYFCEFLETDDAAFRSEEIDRAFSSGVQPFVLQTRGLS
jgi:hypothetical protein